MRREAQSGPRAAKGEEGVLRRGDAPGKGLLSWPSGARLAAKV